MKNVSIALLGCGTVGKGVVDLLQMNGHLIAEQTDTHIHIKHVLVRDIEKYKNVGLDENLHLTDNFKDIIEDDEVEIVVEVMGSADFAKDCLEQRALGAVRVLSVLIRMSSPIAVSVY